MIRINLLEVRPRSAERLDSILSSGRSSTFISRREALVGVLFLALTAGILAMLATRFDSGEGEQDRAVAARTETPPKEAAAIEKAPEPAPPPAAEEPVEPTPETGASAPAEPAAAALSPAAVRRHVLTDARATALADRVDVFLEMSGSPSVSRFRLDDPPRLVFDFAETTVTAADDRRSQSLDSPLVRKVRIGQFSLEPPVVRVVLELGETPAAADVSSSAAGVSIRVTSQP